MICRKQGGVLLVMLLLFLGLKSVARQNGPRLFRLRLAGKQRYINHSQTILRGIKTGRSAIG